MTISTMLGQSIILTGLGLGVVFSFLIIMIVCMTLSSKIIQAFEKKGKKANPNGTSPTATSANDTAIVAAIATALHDKQ